MRASIAIFHNSITYSDSSQATEIPDEVFEAAKRVSVTKKTEVITNNGFYVVEYSENGPFVEHVDNSWFPIKIYRVEEWSCGGITHREIKDFLKLK